MVDKKTAMTDWNLLAKMLSGEEVGQIEQLENELNKNKDFRASSQVWQLAGDVDIFYKIDAKAAFQTFKSKAGFEQKPVKKQVFSLNTMLKMAASIIILLGIAVGLFLSNPAKVTIQTGAEIAEKVLTDGTVIVINTNSILTYNKQFGEKNRKISFTGEAFFNVAKNKDLPFVIETKNSRVEVVGTSFNLKENKDDNIVSLYVNSGKVNFSSKSANNTVLVEPGFEATLDKETKKIKSKKIEDPNYLAWKTKEMVFKETPLNEVALVLEKVYNIKIQFKSEKIKNLKLTANYNNQSLDNVLSIISRTFNLGYKVEKNEVYIFERI